MSEKSELLPWEIPWEEWKELEVSPTKDLLQLAKQLAARLPEKKGGYGHKAAFLYHEWAVAQGKPAVKTWWDQHKGE